MKKIFFIIHLLMTTGICCAQTVLPLYKSLKGQHFNEEKAKFIQHDSILLYSNDRLITGLNLYTGQETIYYRGDTRITSFDIRENAHRLVMLTERRELIVYDLQQQHMIDSVVIDTLELQSKVRLSPSGHQVMLIQPRYAGYRGGDTTLLISLLNVDQLWDPRILSFDSEIIQAEYFSDYLVIVSLRGRAGSSNLMIAAFTFGFKMPLPVYGSGQTYFVADPSHNTLLCHSTIFSGKYRRTVLTRQDTSWNTAGAKTVSMDFINRAGMDISGINHQYILQAGPNTIELWNMDSYGALATYQLSSEGNEKSQLTCSPEGKWFSLSDTSGGLSIYEYPDSLGKKKVAFSDIDIIPQRLSSRSMDELSYSSGIPALAFREASGNAIIYDLSIRQKVKEIIRPTKFKLHPRLNYLLILQSLRLRSLSLYGTDNRILLNDEPVLTFDLNDDGSKIAYQSIRDEFIHIVDYPDGKPDRTVYVDFAAPGFERIRDVQFTYNDGVIIRTHLRRDSLSDTATCIYFANAVNNHAKLIHTSKDLYAKSSLSERGRYYAFPDKAKFVQLFEINKRSCKPVTFPHMVDTLKGYFPYSEDDGFRKPWALKFMDDTSLLIADFKYAYKYNFIKSGAVHRLYNDNMLNDLIYPRDGDLYYKTVTPAAIEICKKEDDSLSNKITNSFFTPSAALFMNNDQAVIASDSLLLLFRINQMKADTAIAIDDDVFSVLKVDTVAKTISHSGWRYLLMADYAKGTTAIENVRRFGYHDISENPGSIINFSLLNNRRLLAVARYNNQNDGFDLSLHHDTDSQFISPLYDTTIASGTLQELVYDSVHNTLYVLASVHEGDSTVLLTISAESIKASVRVFPDLSSYTFILDESRNMAYWLVRNKADDENQIILKIDLVSWRADTIRLADSNLMMVRSLIGNRLILGDYSGNISIVDLNRNKVISSFVAHEGEIKSISVSNANRLLTVGSDCTVRYWDLNRLSLLGTLHFTGRSDFIFINSSNYYMANRNSVKGIAFKVGNRICPVQQFDKYANRPDIILSELDSIGNARMISLYQRAIQKRWGLRTGHVVPELDLKRMPYVRYNKAQRIPAISKSNRYNIQYTVSDTAVALKSVNIFVNHVPVYENGIDLTQYNNAHIPLEENLFLSEGDNRIELVAKNVLDNESVHEIAYIRYEPPRNKKYRQKVYFVAMDIDQFQSSEFDLRYSVNDGMALASELKKNIPSGDLQIDTFFNAHVTRSTLSAIKEKLSHTQVDDKVIFQLSGHGMLDTARSAFYFCTYDTDFKNPSVNAIAYDSILAVMRGVRARKKLVLIDACHSGMLDSTKRYETNFREDTVSVNGKDSVISVMSIAENTVVEPDSGARSGGGGIKLVGRAVEDVESVSFELMQDVFWNIDNDNSDGTFVFTATAGDRVARENGAMKNGIFTYYLVRQLKKGISVKTMADTVKKQVMEYSRNSQKPDIRKENIYIDWDIIE